MTEIAQQHCSCDQLRLHTLHAVLPPLMAPFIQRIKQELGEKHGDTLSTEALRQAEREVLGRTQHTMASALLPFPVLYQGVIWTSRLIRAIFNEDHDQILVSMRILQKIGHTDWALTIYQETYQIWVLSMLRQLTQVLLSCKGETLPSFQDTLDHLRFLHEVMATSHHHPFLERPKA